MHYLYHARSSQKRWGGSVEDYLTIHRWFDESHNSVPDFRHRAYRHHVEGISEAERKFGAFIVNCENKEVPVRLIGEQHVKEDCMGRAPTMADWFRMIAPKPWMAKPGKIRKVKENSPRKKDTGDH